MAATLTTNDLLARPSLIVLPCSSDKQSGGAPTPSGLSALDVLSPSLAQRLVAARCRVEPVAKMKDAGWLAAGERYTGHLYFMAHRLPDAMKVRPIAILSGAYGVALAEEPIRDYDRVFRPGDWPSGLLAACLIDLAHQFELTGIISFCSRTTGYTKVVRQAAARSRLETTMVYAALGAGVGAVRKAPRAAGEALNAYLDGELAPGWQTHDGTVITIEQVRRAR